MKIKLKKDEKLSSNQNYCGLNLDDWIALNQGKQVELDIVPKLIKEKVEEVKSASSKKGGKLWLTQHFPQEILRLGL